MAVAATSSTAQAAYGLDFQSLLKIILTQLTYQDPLKPLDNFEFVSQLGQFAQLQQTQSLNDQIGSLLASQAASQATGLLGHTVDLAGSGFTLTGTVTAVSFASGQPLITIKTTDGQTIGNLSIADVSQVR
ncbi:MAG TPA: flagellar hook capping FlgD N-terminal domain-containing protein [Rhizomicrobium sp.]|jgi:flagellar basal-body rod modification protein FlgD|nr:flagellar hook capping FlgD N-terminal domain-containing protein [Rhizomicrobium sp.]